MLIASNDQRNVVFELSSNSIVFDVFATTSIRVAKSMRKSNASFVIDESSNRDEDDEKDSKHTQRRLKNMLIKLWKFFEIAIENDVSENWKNENEFMSLIMFQRMNLKSNLSSQHSQLINEIQTHIMFAEKNMISYHSSMRSSHTVRSFENEQSILQDYFVNQTLAWT